MLPTTGFFKNIECPYYESTCDRPYCHFRHRKKNSSEATTEPEVAPTPSTSTQIPTYNPTPKSQLVNTRNTHIPVPYVPDLAGLPRDRPFRYNASNPIYKPTPLSVLTNSNKLEEARLIEVPAYNPNESSSDIEINFEDLTNEFEMIDELIGEGNAAANLNGVDTVEVYEAEPKNKSGCDIKDDAKSELKHKKSGKSRSESHKKQVQESDSEAKAKTSKNKMEKNHSRSSRDESSDRDKKHKKETKSHSKPKNKNRAGSESPNNEPKEPSKSKTDKKSKTQDKTKTNKESENDAKHKHKSSHDKTSKKETKSKHRKSMSEDAESEPDNKKTKHKSKSTSDKDKSKTKESEKSNRAKSKSKSDNSESEPDNIKPNPHLDKHKSRSKNREKSVRTKSKSKSTSEDSESECDDKKPKHKSKSHLDKLKGKMKGNEKSIRAKLTSDDSESECDDKKPKHKSKLHLNKPKGNEKSVRIRSRSTSNNSQSEPDDKKRKHTSVEPKHKGKSHLDKHKSKMKDSKSKSTSEGSESEADDKKLKHKGKSYLEKHKSKMKVIERDSESESDDKKSKHKSKSHSNKTKDAKKSVRSASRDSESELDDKKSKHKSKTHSDKHKSRTKEVEKSKSKSKHRSKTDDEKVAQSLSKSQSKPVEPIDYSDNSELSDSVDDTMKECFRIFTEYKPTEPEIFFEPPAPPSDEALPVIHTKKRVAHDNAIQTKLTYTKPKTCPSAAQVMMDRFKAVRAQTFDEQSEIMAEVNRHVLKRQAEKSELPTKKLRVEQPQKQPSSLVDDIINGGRATKRRIAPVLNADLIQKAKAHIEEIKARVKTSNSKTSVQTVLKGAKRVAHVPEPAAALDIPDVLEIERSKLPVNVRSRFLAMMVDECLKLYYNREEAHQRAVTEEFKCYERCAVLVTYRNSAMLAINRLRKERQEREAAGLDLILPGETSTSNKEVSNPLRGREFYNNIIDLVLSEEELVLHGFPRESSTPGRANIKPLKNTPVILNYSENDRVCARCLKHYQVDDDGLVLYEEECLYHPLKKRTFRGESIYLCCKSSDEGGCVTSNTHVSDSNAADCDGYQTTLPPNDEDDPRSYAVYALDCEMCYTTKGLELTRVTVVNPDCQTVYETLVKPLNPIIDYNTRFSGITKEQMERTATSILQVQANILHLCNSKTILIGHSLESDMKALKIIHNTIIDTSVLFPHKFGLPHKRALRDLAREYLKKIIQNDISGHDSAEDALTCMELVQWKVKEEGKAHGAKT